MGKRQIERRFGQSGFGTASGIRFGIMDGMTKNNLPEKFPNFVIFKTADGKAGEQLACREFRHATEQKSEDSQ